MRCKFCDNCDEDNYCRVHKFPVYPFAGCTDFKLRMTPCREELEKKEKKDESN